MEYQSTQYDGYPEWNFAGAISLLSIIVDRKLCVNLRQQTIYPNIWSLCLGDSTTARKSTAMQKSKKFLFPLGLDGKMLPDSFSPESFIEVLSDNPHTFYWKDEAAGLLANMQRTYMSDMRDLFCALYENETYRRALRTSQRKKDQKKTDFFIEDPYLVQWLMTTPDNFKAHAASLDVTSGWLVRYLYLAPDYPKTWMGFTQQTTNDIKGFTTLLDLLSFKIKQLSSVKGSLEMTLSAEAWKFFEEWQKTSEEKIQKDGDRLAGTIFGRLEPYAIKLAMLFEFGKPANKFKGIIERETIEEACRLITEYFLPTAKQVIQTLQTDESKNVQDKILGVIRRNGGEIQRSKLLQHLHIPVKDVEKHIGALIASEEISFNQNGKSISYKLQC